MKKQFLVIGSGNAPMYTSRRFPQTRFANVAYKTDGGSEDDEEALLTKIQSKIDKALEGRATKAELEQIKQSQQDGLKGLDLVELRKIADAETGVMAILARQGLELQRLQKSGSEKPQDLSTRGQIKAWLDSKNELNSKGEEVEGSISVREAIAQIKNGKKVELRALELQRRDVNSPMLPADTYNGSAYLPKPEIQAGIVDIIRVQPTFWEYLKKGSTNSAAYVWVNKKNKQGAAAFIAPGVYKPGTSFELGTEISNAKKIAVNEKVAIEILDDIDGFASWIEMELMYSLKIELTTTLLTAAGSTTVPTGICELAVPFSTGLGIKTTNPNNWDVIRACVAQLKRANFGQYAVTTFMNPIDYANMVMTKANNQGQLFIPPVTGSTIVEDNNIAVGSVLVACLDLYKILIYKGFTIQYGLENDDFTKNLRTVIGEMRLHQIFSENHVGAFIYDTYDNVIEAITETPEV